MNPQGIMIEQRKLKRELSEKNIEYERYLAEKDKAEKLYRIALAKKMAILRIDKHPVSLINDMSRGDEDVAELRFKRDRAVSNCYVCRNKMENLKFEIEINRSLLAWLKEELKNS